MTSKLCECGCGQPTRQAPYSFKARGWVKGQPILYINGHSLKNRGGTPSEYLVLWKNGRTVQAHRVLIETLRGLHLPQNAEIHHVNGNGRDNRHSNLVVCQDRAYHWLLERRTRALKACGDAGAIRCNYCKEYDSSSRRSRTSK